MERQLKAAKCMCTTNLKDFYKLKYLLCDKRK